MVTSILIQIFQNYLKWIAHLECMNGLFIPFHPNCYIWLGQIVTDLKNVKSQK